MKNTYINLPIRNVAETDKFFASLGMPKNDQYSSADTTNAKINENTFDWVALLLLVIGGINWGTIAVFSTDLVSAVFGDMTAITRVVYRLVGVSAVYSLYILTAKTE